MRKKHSIYLHTGSNQGDRNAFLIKANKAIEEQIGKITKQSKLYETAAWGNTEQPDFINQALVVETSLDPAELMVKVLEIENEIGRIREQKWGARIIDIDILFYEDQVIETVKLIVPHPFLHQRNFVLIPLMEIAPYFIHPVLNLSIEELYLRSKDPLEVSLLPS